LILINPAALPQFALNGEWPKADTKPQIIGLVSLSHEGNKGG
jgi:hypothetical protein